jgi:AcrR family transcriptional regulator
MSKVRERESYRHGNLPDTLVRDALKQLETESAEKVSLRVLADNAGVSPRAPYQHFPTRQALLDQVALLGLRALQAQLNDSRFELFEICESYIDFAVNHSHLFRLMFALETAQKGRAEVRACFERAIIKRRPDLDSLQLSNATYGLWSMAHGMALLRINEIVCDDVMVGEVAWEFVDCIQVRTDSIRI